MISSLLLLSAVLFTNPVIISEVKATRETRHLRVDVIGDGGIDPEGARTRLSEGQLLIYLEGTRVRADNRAWELADGAGEIRAHRHRTETELVIPLAGNGCTGPVELTGSPTGISALVGCDGPAPAAARTARAAARTMIATDAEGKTSEVLITNQRKLKALVELPAADATLSEEAAVPAAGATAPAAPAALARPVAPVAASAPASAPAAAIAKPVAVAKPAAEAEEAPATAPVLEIAPPKPVTVDRSAGSPSSSLRAVAIPAILLAALAVAAYWFARRRKGTFERHVQVIETTSLGPKRSLIIVKVDGETLVLGSSEGGITLLKGGAGGSVGSPAAAAAAVLAAVPTPQLDARGATDAPFPDISVELDQPLEEALADIPEPNGVGGRAVAGRAGFRAIEGGLAGLFGRRDSDSDKPETSDRFDDLLEDSLEDQELRRKLAAGMSARAR